MGGDIGRGVEREGDEVDSRPTRLAVKIGEGEGLRGELARGVVECERWSSESILSRGVIGLGIPGMYPGRMRDGTGEARRSSGSTASCLSKDMAIPASKTADVRSVSDSLWVNSSVCCIQAMTIVTDTHVPRDRCRSRHDNLVFSFCLLLNLFDSLF